MKEIKPLEMEFEIYTNTKIVENFKKFLQDNRESIIDAGFHDSVDGLTKFWFTTKLFDIKISRDKT